MESLLAGADIPDSRAAADGLPPKYSTRFNRVHFGRALWRYNLRRSAFWARPPGDQIKSPRQMQRALKLYF